MSAMASQITSLMMDYSGIYSGADQRKHQSSVSLAFVWGTHRWPLMTSSWVCVFGKGKGLCITCEAFLQYSDIPWASYRLIAAASGLLANNLLTNIIKALHHWTFVREIHRRCPEKAGDIESKAMTWLHRAEWLNHTNSNWSRNKCVP